MLYTTSSMCFYEKVAMLSSVEQPCTFVQQQEGLVLIFLGDASLCCQRFEETMKTVRTPSLRVVYLFFLVAVLSSGFDCAWAAGGPGLFLVSPLPGVETIAKKPKISFKSDEILMAEGMLVLLDGDDISGLVTEENNVYSIIPPEPLAAGEHLLYVTAYTEDGATVEKEFSFSSRQSELFEEIYSNNRVSVTLKTLLERDLDRPSELPSDDDTVSSEEDYPDITFDSYLSSESVIHQGKWETSARANLRYYDQNAALRAPEKKGLSVLDFLLSATYTADGYGALLEMGDTTIEESANTIDSLTRRGVKAQVRVGPVTVSGFGVLGEESGPELDEIGLGFDSNDHIMGASLKSDFFDQQVSLRMIYARGGQEGDNSFGSWSGDEGRKGDVAGIVLTTDFFEQKLTTECEFDSVNFDGNTGDEQGEGSDKAYRIVIGGLTEVYDYELSYKYTGPEYDVVGNQSIVKDWAGFEFGGGMAWSDHQLRLQGSYAWDNVEDKNVVPRIYSLTAGIDYQYSGWEHFPAGLTFEHNSQRSQDEPDDVEETATDTNTITGRIGYIDGPWSVDFQAGYSEQDDKGPNDYDTELITVSLAPTYSQTSFSLLPSWTINHSKDVSSGIVTDINTITLDLQSYVYQELISGEIGGTCDWTKTDDDQVDTNNISLYARLSYRFEKLGLLEEANITVEYLYNRQEDRREDSTTRESILTPVLSSAIPYSF